jgi:hypothetical protein
MAGRISKCNTMDSPHSLEIISEFKALKVKQRTNSILAKSNLFEQEEG